MTYQTQRLWNTLLTHTSKQYQTTPFLTLSGLAEAIADAAKNEVTAERALEAATSTYKHYLGLHRLDAETIERLIAKEKDSTILTRHCHDWMVLGAFALNSDLEFDKQAHLVKFADIFDYIDPVLWNTYYVNGDGVLQSFTEEF